MAKSLHLCYVSGDNQPIIEGVKAIIINSDDAGAVRATEDLTFTDVGTADETVTIGSVTYTLKAAPAEANEIDIGASATETAANLAAAINGGAGEGTAYGTGTVAHPDVFASADTGVVTVTARVYGTAGNSIATTETSAVASFGAATLSGGTIAAVQTEAVAAANRAKGVSIFLAGYFDTVLPISDLTNADNPLFADTAAIVIDQFDGVSTVAAA